MKKRLIFAGIISICLICGFLYYFSSYSEHDLKLQVAEMQGKELDLNFKNAEVYFNGFDTIYKGNGANKLVIFVDSLSCAACSLNNLIRYYVINDTLRQRDGHIVIVLHSQKSRVNDIRKKIKVEKFPFWCIIDKKGEFIQNNPFIPNNIVLHSFMLDIYNRITLVGDPSLNPKIKELFLNQLTRNAKDFLNDGQTRYEPKE